MAAAAPQLFLLASSSGMGRADDASVARVYANLTGTGLPGKREADLPEDKEETCPALLRISA